jgi:hypothetical protein
MNNLNFKGQNIYAGFDVHLKSWKVTLLGQEMMLKSFTMPPKPEALSWGLVLWLYFFVLFSFKHPLFSTIKTHVRPLKDRENHIQYQTNN